MKTLSLSEPVKKLIIDAAQDVWQEIGAYTLVSMAEFGYKNPRSVNTVTISRTHVVEIVMDAGRLEERIRHLTRNAPPNPELYNLLRMWNVNAPSAEWGLAHDTIRALVRAAFPCTRYGM